MEEWDIAPPFLTSALDGGFTPRPLYHRIQKVNGGQSRSRRYGQEKYLLTFRRIETRFLSIPARNIVVIQSELSRLSGVHGNVVVISDRFETRILKYFY